MLDFPRQAAHGYLGPRHELARCGGACAFYPIVLPDRCSVDGLQISNFRPACVRANPLVKQFYAALDAGTHEAFVHQPGLWWGCPILDHAQRRWSSLYMRNSTFRGWAESQPPSASHAAAQPAHAAAAQQWQPPPAAPLPPYAAPSPPPPPQQQQHQQ